MVLISRENAWLSFWVALALLGLSTTTALSAEGSTAGEVTLPLERYLEWVEAAEAQAEAAKAAAEPSSITWVDHQTTLRLTDREQGATERDSRTVRVDMSLSARVVGRPETGLPLEFDGFVSDLAIEPEGGSGSDPPAPPAVWSSPKDSPLELLAVSPGAYNIRVTGQLVMAETRTGQRFELPQPLASVSKLVVELPADLRWRISDDPVLVGDQVLAGKRTLTFAVARGTSAWMEILADTVTAGADRLLASSVVATVIQLQREQWQRHDVAMFDVSRGSLDAMELGLPDHVSVTDAVTDEGPVRRLDPASARLEINRRRPLKSGGSGYVALVSPLSSSVSPSTATIDLTTVVPGVEARAHYLVMTGPAPVEAKPSPADHWVRADAGDLPKALGEALGVTDLVAVWRRVDGKDAGRLEVLPLPDAPRIESWVSERSTTTLLTVDGTLLHRDLLVIAPVGQVLEVELPERAVLWSVKVGEESIRPLERNGKMLIPMSLAPVDGASVEIVTVLERVVPPGRSVLDLELPRLGLPVVEHIWRILLPKEDRYRYRDGTLSVTEGQRATSTLAGVSENGSTALMGVLTDGDQYPLPGVTVSVESSRDTKLMQVTNASGAYRFLGLPPGQVSVTATLEGFTTIVGTARLKKGRITRLDMVMPIAAVSETIVVTSEATVIPRGGSKKRAAEVVVDEQVATAQVFADYQANVAGLQQGLVGGVRPLPVTIPEEGKSLTLIGVLPPRKVTASLDVKAGR